MKKPILILKIGTASISRADGSLDEPVLVEMARQVAQLHRRYRIVMVSSGAVGAGKRLMKHYQGQVKERKAAAAIGNPLLINKYQQFFAPYGITIAQSLCERRHFSERFQFLQLRETFDTLWEHEVIPIANENDVVSSLEIRFSDNDELATLMAIGFGAEKLLLGTSVPGVLDAQGRVVSRIEQFDEQVMGLAQKKKSDAGLGGMISKLTFARLATRMGIKVVIFGLEQAGSILEAEAEQTGTICLPQKSTLSARNKWLASSSLVSGRIVIDEGAYQALGQRKSLLAVGLLELVRPFEKGEVFELVRVGEEAPFALARAKVSATYLASHPKTKGLEIAHADDIVFV
ncbi:MAG: glutamate 5-kinase [Bacteroidota bacterium]